CYLPRRALHSFPTRRSSDLRGRVQSLHYFLDRQRGECTFDDARELGTIGDAPRVVVETLVAPELRCAEHFRAKPRPLPLVLNARSEEHTSELQSPYDLVCRL